MLVAMHSVLRPGEETAYEEAHAAVWPDLLDRLRAAGFREWHIWRGGIHLFHAVEVDDFESAMRAMGADPVNERWQKHIGQFVDRFEYHDGAEAPGEPNVPVDPVRMMLRHVWTMSEQLSSQPLDPKGESDLEAGGTP